MKSLILISMILTSPLLLRAQANPILMGTLTIPAVLAYQASQTLPDDFRPVLNKTDVFILNTGLGAAAVAADTKHFTANNWNLIAKDLEKKGFKLQADLIRQNNALIKLLTPRSVRLRLLAQQGLIRANALASAGMMGYTVGEAVVEYDKNHWNGGLVQKVSEYGEPVFKQVYRVQKHFEERSAGSAR